MKSVILFLLAALFLSGCTSPFWDDDPDTEAFRLFQTVQGSSFGMTPEGCYYVDLLTDPPLLTYKQTDSADARVVCWMIDCSHKTTDCPAYCSRQTTVLDTTDDETVYLLQCGPSSDLIRIYRVDPANRRHNLIKEYSLRDALDLESITSFSYSRFCLYGQNLYLALSAACDGTPTDYLLRVDLRTDTVSSLLTDTQSLDPFAIHGDLLYLNQQYGPQEYALEEYRLASGASQELARAEESLFVDAEGHIFYKIRQNDTYSFVRLDPASNTSLILRNTTPDALYTTGAMFYAGYLNIMMESEDQPLYYLDTRTGAACPAGQLSIICAVQDDEAAIQEFISDTDWILRRIPLSDYAPDSLREAATAS